MGSSSPRRIGRVAALLLVPVLALTLTACTEEKPSPEDAAAALAEGIADGDLDGVTFAGLEVDVVTAYREAVFEPLADVDRTVKVSDVVVDTEGDAAGGHAAVTLAYSWDLTKAKAWDYTTTVDMTLVEPAEGEDGPAKWAVTWQPDVLVPDLEDGDRLALTRLRADRADILDGAGQPLVTDRPVYRIGVDKTRVDAAGWDTAARALAVVAGLDPDAYAAQVAAAGEKAFVEAITVRTGDTAGVDVEAAKAIDGAVVIDGELPLAPTREFARPILGRVGDATAEIVEESKGAIVAGDTVGLSGLQRQYDAQLRGTPGLLVQVVGDGTAANPAGPDTDADGVADPVKDVTDVFRQEPVAGVPLQTTFQPDLQMVAESILAEDPAASASPSAIVAIKPSTGDVLAVASGAASEGLSTATVGKYAPGSTFKVASALGMLRAGMTPDTVVPCTPTLDVDGRTFQNVPGYPASALGDVPLRTAFANSCNTAMISTRDTVSQQALHDAAAALGLGVEGELGAPAFYGSVPADSAGTEHAASLIGQGKVEASPLAMATLAASVAKGERVSPVLVRPDVTPASSETEPPADAVTADEAEQLRSLMRSVVTDGSATFLKGLPGDVAAKTGTAQYGDGTRAHAWMLAIQGDLAVAVFVEDGEYGSTTAGPLLEKFLTAPLGGE